MVISQYLWNEFGYQNLVTRFPLYQYYVQYVVCLNEIETQLLIFAQIKNLNIFLIIIMTRKLKKTLMTRLNSFISMFML